jgi:hypothetical protein
MKGLYIESGKASGRSPAAAFFLSLFFPGLGQVYNAGFSKGVTFFALRVLPLLIVPVYAALRRPDSGLCIFIAMISASLSAPVISAIHACLGAGRGAEIPVKPYNNTAVYWTFGAVCSIATAAAVLFLGSMFSAATVHEKTPGPYLAVGDAVLLCRVQEPGPKKGEMVIKADGSAWRVAAIGNDRAAFVKGELYVNGSPLPTGVPDDGMALRMGAGPMEKLFTEKNGGRTYAVLSGGKGLNGDYTPGGGRLLLVKDDRSAGTAAEIVPVSSVSWRIEGVIFSMNVRKMFLEPSFK